MTDYTKNTNFTAKDALASGNPAKIITGVDFDSEFDELAVSIATKLDNINSLSTVSTLNLAGDYFPVYSLANTDDMKVKGNIINPISGSFVAMRGNAIQIIGAAAYTEVNTLAVSIADRGGCGDANGSTGGQIALPSADYDGLWLVVGRIGYTAVSGTVRLSVTRFNSGGTAQSRQYIEINDVHATPTIMSFGLHSLTFASGDYVALEVFIQGGGAISAASSNQIFGFKLY